MIASQDELRPDSPNLQRDGNCKPPRLTILGAICGLALLLFAAVQLPQRNSDAARVAEPAPESASQTPSTPFEYFPAQYHSNTKSVSPEEHIQAF